MSGKSTNQQSGKESKGLNPSLEANKEKFQELQEENQALLQELQKSQNLEAMLDKRVFRLSLIQMIGLVVQEIRGLTKQVNVLGLQFQALNQLTKMKVEGAGVEKEGEEENSETFESAEPEIEKNTG